VSVLTAVVKVEIDVDVEVGAEDVTVLLVVEVEDRVGSRAGSGLSNPDVPDTRVHPSTVTGRASDCEVGEVVAAVSEPSITT
jgi:hypothetical protein